MIGWKREANKRLMVRENVTRKEFYAHLPLESLILYYTKPPLWNKGSRNGHTWLEVAGHVYTQQLAYFHWYMGRCIWTSGV